ncbi:hypothetical protein E0H22_17420 [Rhodopseudomonas boonkerdii]|uniref:DUF6949 family protein n=1 Tax=Rhodopseudomonas boonkerdii TaxID=475937 RepID=UPI001E3559E6|nr:hypothetical protein [Rhodopseudomonas boonkerdii]UGV27308.1 hypothetical protein E0H22_17420 [Rhodopseudomonas boonkerdii]
MSPIALNCFIQIAIGFAIAGAVASAYQTLASRPPSFALLQQGPTPESFAAVPLLVFTAPFIIMRNTLRSGVPEPHRFQFVMIATVIAGFWSLMSGTFIVLTLQALGIIAGA